MAHTKAGGSTRQKGNRTGKRRGVKTFGGEKVSTGNIIIRQTGSSFRAASGVGTGKDFTLFALRNGIVRFFNRKDKRYVEVS